MNNKIFQENAKVIYTKEIAHNTFETMLSSPNISKYVQKCSKIYKIFNMLLVPKF